MTLTLAALVFANLLYLAGAVVVASLVSAFYVLRHRKPKSLESGIESFSRELRALAPEHRAEGARTEPVSPSEGARPPTLRARSTAGGTGPRRSTGGSVATATGRRLGADTQPSATGSKADDDAAEAGGPAPGLVAPGPSLEDLEDLEDLGESTPAPVGPDQAAAPMPEDSPAKHSQPADRAMPPPADGNATSGGAPSG